MALRRGARDFLCKPFTAEQLGLEGASQELENLVERMRAMGMGDEQIQQMQELMRKLMETGSRYVIKKGYGWDSDLEATEAHGVIPNADASLVSDVALDRADPVVGEQHDVGMLLQQRRGAGVELDDVAVVGLVLGAVEALDKCA